MFLCTVPDEYHCSLDNVSVNLRIKGASAASSNYCTGSNDDSLVLEDAGAKGVDSVEVLLSERRTLFRKELPCNDHKGQCDVPDPAIPLIIFGPAVQEMPGNYIVFFFARC